jgi:hypothetical protein
MPAVTARGRRVWGISGVLTTGALAALTVQLITHNALAWPTSANAQPYPQATLTRTITVSQPVTSVTVDTSGNPVRVMAGRVSRIEITEMFSYDKQAGEPPAVTPSVSRGGLALNDSACSSDGCGVGFSLVVPPGVAATVGTEGGPVAVTGTAGTVVDSGGGPVTATGIGGQLTVTTGGGPLEVHGLTGILHADTGGGPLSARDVTSIAAQATSEGGDVALAFAAAPESVNIDTGGGGATLLVPGGPYALTADTGGGNESLQMAADPAAPRSITISTEGGELLIRSTASGAAPGQKAVPPPPKP